MAPGPELAASLAGIDVRSLAGHDQVIVLRAHQRLASHFQAKVYEDMAAVADTVQDEDDDPALGYASAVAEVQAALRLTRRAAEAELTTAYDLAEGLPKVGHALGTGHIDVRRAKTLIHGVSHVPRDTGRRVVDSIIAEAGGLTTGQLAARVRRLCIQADPDYALQRLRATVEHRRVVLEASPDGTANILGLDLSPERAVAVSRRVNRLARSLPADDRTMDQRRADVFVDLLLGLDGGTRSPGTVDLRVDLTTLIGLSEEPGELIGYGPVIADICRQVVSEQHDAKWRFTVTDPDTSDRRWDHQTPPDRGPTPRGRETQPDMCISGLPHAGDRLRSRPSHPLGTRRCHHRRPIGAVVPAPSCDYHHAGWQHQPLADGDHLWTSRLGHHYTTSGKPP